MSAESLVFISLGTRWFVLVASATGLLIASLCFIEAQRTVRANADDRERSTLALSRRSSEALSVAAQLAFMAVGLSFVSFPPAPPSSPSQVGPYFDGILRTGGFGLGALVLALKSLLNLRTETSLSLPRLMREQAHLADLQAANLKLERATRTKSDFLANMSHELRTPLNAILGFSDILAEQLGAQMSADQRRYLRNVRDSGEHLLELINDVLDISKVEAGRLELRPEIVRLGPLLEPVIASTRASADQAGLAFEAIVPDDGMARADPARLRQILYNLLSNAVKFTPRGGSVRLRMRFEGADLSAEVRDTGIGIPLSERHRVFGTFERLHEGRSEATGTGLGLALTKSLVELHRGTITFDSEEGRGTTFRVVLPEAHVEPVHGRRLLVVEDVHADADLIVALAAEAGLASEVVTTVRGALDAIRDDPPCGVALDLRLPDERGEQVLWAMKADPGTRGIPVVVVTVEDDDGRSRPLGADDHLTKPIDRQRLATWLRGLTVA